MFNQEPGILNDLLLKDYKKWGKKETVDTQELNMKEVRQQTVLITNHMKIPDIDDYPLKLSCTFQVYRFK